MAPDPAVPPAKRRVPRSVPDGGAEPVRLQASLRDPAQLQHHAEALGVALGSGQAEALVAFCELVQRWNQAFNLVSRRDIGRLVPRHVLDSLSVVPWLSGSEVLDLGTGAGFPGIPLAIAREDVQFTLIDSNARKIRFVRQAVRSLGLGNVSPHCADVRALDANVTFDTVVCRGVAEPDSAWRLARARVRPQGLMVIMSRTRGSAAAGPPRPEALSLSADARLERRHRVQIPGLPEPHELTLLRHRGEPAGQRP